MWVVVAPFVVIVWRVAVVAGAPKQLVPFARQTDWPAMRRLEPEAEVKAKVVAVAFVATRFVVVASVTVRDERERGEETVREPMVALFAKRLVLVTVVPVRVVKVPAAGVEPPITVLLIVPPEIVALEEEREAEDREPMDAVFAFNVVPEAVAKPSQEVEVPFVNERLEMVPFVIVPLVKTPFVAKRLVVVTLVAVAFVAKTSPNVESPVTFNVPVAVRDEA